LTPQALTVPQYILNAENNKEMRPVLMRMKTLYTLSCVWVLVSFIIAECINQAEIFGASGAIMVLVGVILPARTYFRLGHEKYFEAQDSLDLGTYGETETAEELAAEKEKTKDGHAYRVSFPILIVGTLIWAYGALIMKQFGYR
jgi:hypothetical protein